MSSDGEGAPPAPASVPPPIIGAPPERRVVRLSRTALAVIALVGGTGLGGALIWSFAPRVKAPPIELYDAAHRPSTDAVAAVPKDYTQVPKLGSPLPGDLGRPILDAQSRGVDTPVPTIGGPAVGRPMPGSGVEAVQAARERGRQERDSARTSKLFLASTAARGTADTRPTPMPAVPTVPAVAVSSHVAAGSASGAGEDDQARKRAFLAGDGERAPVGAARLEPLVSPYTLQAGSIIQAALITGLRSDLPGQITAQVTANVYDSPTGTLLLIPQGAKLIGEYDSSVAFGQDRLLLAWTRLILPDGRSLLLAREPGADAAGFAGVQDAVNHHWGGVAKAALLSTVLAIGAEAGNGGDSDLLRALRQGTADTLNQAGQQIVRRQLDVQPTITIRPGFPVRVIVTHDLILAPADKEE
ncbi:MAG: TrbI/VirB10 family protein [Sphingomonas sp.]|uniref:TrbI/VirB10 family protein n=1 Tax=Sphingomonas sp. TaxID=28214 RepID=UPI003568664D